MTAWLRRRGSRLDKYVLAILASVGLAALVPARGGGARAVDVVSQGAIALLFLLYGARISAREMWRGLRHWRLQGTVLAATFALFPLMGLAFHLLGGALLPPVLVAGVAFLCLLPSTVQSSIAFTSLAGGDVPAAICAASISNLSGVVLTPLLATVVLGSEAHISAGSMLRIALQILVPFGAGQLVRPVVGPALARHRSRLALGDRGTVLIVVYSAFSAGVVAGIWHQLTPSRLALVLGVDGLILAAVLATTWIGSGRLGFALPERIAVLFCGSKKSIATGIPMAAVLFPRTEVSLIVVPAMLFHQIQLMICALLARRFADARAVTGTEVGAEVGAAPETGTAPGVAPRHVDKTVST